MRQPELTFCLWSANVAVGACLAECKSVDLTLFCLDSTRRRPFILCRWAACLSGALSMSPCELLATIWLDRTATSSSRARRRASLHLRLCLCPPPLSILCLPPPAFLPLISRLPSPISHLLIFASTTLPRHRHSHLPTAKAHMPPTRDAKASARRGHRYTLRVWAGSCVVSARPRYRGPPRSPPRTSGMCGVEGILPRSLAHLDILRYVKHAIKCSMFTNKRYSSFI